MGGLVMAFTATKNVPLAATTTGSWPRPAWYTQSLWGRPLDTAMLDPIYREQFSDALAVVVSDQERAGLDIVTCGDYFLDADSGPIVAPLSIATLAGVGVRRIAARKHPFRTAEVSTWYAAQRNLYILAVADRHRQDSAQPA